MIKIQNKIFNATVEDILYKIQKETNFEYLKNIKLGIDNIMITCPFHANHSEKHPSCGIVNNESQDNYGVFNCFTCGQSGTILNIICECLGINVLEAVEWLEINFGKVFVNNIQLLPEINLDNSKGIDFMDENILEQYKYFHPYMFKRKLTEDIIRRFNIGCTEDGKYITFPCRDINGNLIGICKRSTIGKEFILPKNMPKCVYLLDYVVKNNITKVCVCEGQFDALVLWSYGYPAIALFGSGTSKTQLEILNKSGIREYILMYDNDTAGRHGANRFKNHINKDVFITDIIMPEGKDCADCSKEEIDNIFALNSINFS